MTNETLSIGYFEVADGSHKENVQRPHEASKVSMPASWSSFLLSLSVKTQSMLSAPCQ